MKAPTDSGLIITLREPPSVGIVMAVGEGQYKQDGSFEAIKLHVGDRVHFNKTAGQIVEVEGRQLLLLPYTDIFAVILP